MKIKIAERLRPFAHLPGTYCLLPLSSLRLQIFPTLIRIHAFDCQVAPVPVGEIVLNLRGPVKNFTVQQDLEKGEVKVWGTCPQGYFCYRIFLSAEGFLSVKFEQTFTLACTPNCAYELKRNETLSSCMGETEIHIKDELIFKTPSTPAKTPKPQIHERLSLGSHKAQDWEMIKRRMDFGEIFPCWFRLAALIPHSSAEFTSPLVDHCREMIQQKQRNEILTAFYPLFAAGFEGILTPRAFDTEYQGFDSVLAPGNTHSPLPLLTQGAQLIRALFLEVNAQALSILPALPTEFHSGRGVQWHCEGIGLVDFEWSKKELRRLFLYATATQTIEIAFQKQLHKMRIRTNSVEKGKIVACDAPVEIQKDQLYIFDNFQH